MLASQALRRMASGAVALCVSARIVAAQIEPQRRWSFDGGGSYAWPTVNLAGVALDGGPGVGGTIGVRIRTHLAAYGGWDWTHFESSGSVAGSHRHYEDAGISAGFRFEHPFRGRGWAGLRYRVELGATLRHMDIEDAGGNTIGDSGPLDAGLDCAVGIVSARWRAVQLVPMVRFRSWWPEFVIGGAGTSGALRYAQFQLLMSRGF